MVQKGTENIRLMSTLEANWGGWANNWSSFVQEGNIECLIHHESEYFGLCPDSVTVTLTTRTFNFPWQQSPLSIKLRVWSIKYSKSVTTLQLHFRMYMLSNKANSSTMQWLFLTNSQIWGYPSKFLPLNRSSQLCIRCTCHFRCWNSY